MASKTEIEALFAMAMDAYPMQANETAESLKRLSLIWEDILRNVPVDVLRATMRQYLASEREFRPTCGAIYQAAMDLTAPKRLTEGEAWGMVLRAMDGHGPAEAPPFDDPLVGEIVRSMGWYRLCNTENVAADRAKFCADYRARVEREEADRRMLPEVRAMITSRRRGLELKHEAALSQRGEGPR